MPVELPPLLRRLYASRGVRSIQELERSVRDMLSWQQLSGAEEAVEVPYNVFHEGTRTTAVGDFDTDGTTSTALSVLVVRPLGCSNIDCLIPNRFEDGYGLSPEVADQAHVRGAQLIVMVDNGISFHAGIEYARPLGIPATVVNHHLPGDTLPVAEAIINLNLRDRNFPSKPSAGVGVTSHLMPVLHTFLCDQGWSDEHGIAISNLTELLDLVVLGTAAGVVPLDTNNRILTWQGMSRIRAGKRRPGIKALLEVVNRDSRKLAASDLGSILGLHLNVVGRLDGMSIGAALLLCGNIDEARALANEFDILSQTCKEIKQGMQVEALTLCEKPERSCDTLPGGLAMYHLK